MTGVTVVGVRGQLVAVEAHVGRGLPSLILTGRPDTEVSSRTWPSSSGWWAWILKAEHDPERARSALNKIGLVIRRSEIR